jgi:hypothetical protein
MATGKITKRAVDALASTGKTDFLWDDELRGFVCVSLPTALSPTSINIGLAVARRQRSVRPLVAMGRLGRQQQPASRQSDWRMPSGKELILQSATGSAVDKPST